MSVLVFVEHDNASMKDATLAAVTAAGKLGEVHALVAGSGCGAVAEAAAKIAGVTKVHVADDAAYANQLAENVAPLIAGLAAHHDAFVFPATSHGKNIAPRVAALLDVMQISDILSVESADTFTRPIYAGNAIATVQSSAMPRRSSPFAAPPLPRQNQPAVRPASKPFRAAAMQGYPASSRQKSPSRNVLN